MDESNGFISQHVISPCPGAERASGAGRVPGWRADGVVMALKLFDVPSTLRPGFCILP